MEVLKKIVTTAILFLLAGCASVPDKPARIEVIPGFPARVDLRDADAVLEILHKQYAEWRSVKYRLGGLTKQGIDCSGFVYITYRSTLGIMLPNTTKTQSKVGRRITQKRLRAGDLVFFRTSFSTRHVGIYLESRKFMHVSTKKGVMISSLDNAYWSKKYWKSMRIEI
jgi:cell wall-associated NlpC family hydrolase